MSTDHAHWGATPARYKHEITFRFDPEKVQAMSGFDVVMVPKTVTLTFTRTRPAVYTGDQVPLGRVTATIEGVTPDGRAAMIEYIEADFPDWVETMADACRPEWFA
jgi:hypothetical protein